MQTMTEITKLTEQQRKQNTFDKVWAHSAQMTERSFDQSKDSCVYRAPDGNRCFIGALFPDELYDLNMEEKSAEDLIEEFRLESYFIDNGLTANVSILQELQSIHDDDFHERQKRLLWFASDQHLVVPE